MSFEGLFEWKTSGEGKINQTLKGVKKSLVGLKSDLGDLAKQPSVVQSVFGNPKELAGANKQLGKTREEYEKIVKPVKENTKALDKRFEKLNAQLVREQKLLQQIQTEMAQADDPALLDQLIEKAETATYRIQDLQTELGDLQVTTGRASPDDMWGGGYEMTAYDRSQMTSGALMMGAGSASGFLREMEMIDEQFGKMADSVDLVMTNTQMLLDVFDTFKQLRDVQKSLTTATTAASTGMTAVSVATGATATTAAPAAIGLGGVAAGLGAMLLPLAPLAIAAAGIAALFFKMRKEAEEARERTLATLDTQQSYFEFVATATSEDVSERIAAINQEGEARRMYYEQLENDLRVVQDFDLDSGFVSDVIERFRQTGLEQTGEAFSQWLGDLDSTIEDELFAADFSDNFDSIVRVLDEFGGSIDDGQIETRLREIATETNQASNEESRLTDERTRSIIAINDEIAARRQARENMDDALSLMTDLANTILDTSEAYEQSLLDFEEENAFQRQREMEDRRRDDESALESHLENMEDMEATTRDNIRTIRQELSDSLRDAVTEFKEANVEAYETLQEDLATVATETNEGVLNAQENYREEMITSEEEFNRDRLKSEEQYQKERKRRIEDMNEALLDAEMNNDVLAFMEAEKQGKKDLKRMGEDFAEQEGEASEAYQRMRIERTESLNTEIADLRNNAVERRAELMSQYAEERQARADEHRERVEQIRDESQARVDAERESLALQLAEAQDSFDEQMRLTEEQRQLMDERREEDIQRQLDSMEEAHEAEMAQLEEQQDRILGVLQSGGEQSVQQVEENERRMRAEQLNSYRTALGYMNQMARDAERQLSQTSNSINQRINAARRLFGGQAVRESRSSRYSQDRGVLAAKGAVITRPTMLIAGEGERPEVVFPFDPSEGLDSRVVGSLLPADRLRDSFLSAFNEMRIPTPTTPASFTTPSPSVQFNAPITIGGEGSGVSVQFVKQQMTMMGQTIVDAINDSRAGGKRG